MASEDGPMHQAWIRNEAPCRPVSENLWRFLRRLRDVPIWCSGAGVPGRSSIRDRLLAPCQTPKQAIISKYYKAPPEPQEGKTKTSEAQVKGPCQLISVGKKEKGWLCEQPAARENHSQK